jgi:hypothetical protein
VAKPRFTVVPKPSPDDDPRAVTLGPKNVGDDLGTGPRRKIKPNWNELSQNAIVIAIDPGGTTGWSLMSFHPDVFSADGKANKVDWRRNLEVWRHGQVDCGSLRGNLDVEIGGSPIHEGISAAGEAAGCNELIGLLRAWPGAAVVIESFFLREFSKNQDLLSPQRITSVLNYDLWFHQRPTAFAQQPALAKTYATDEKLKAWKLYERFGGMGHARDADRHAVTFVQRCLQPGKKAAELTAAAWPHLYGKGGLYAG